MKKISLLIIAISAITILFVWISSLSKNLPASQVEDALSEEELQEVFETKAAISTSVEAQRYVHPTLGFSFEKPEGYSIGVVGGPEDGQTLIVQSLAGDVRLAFQIVITPLSERLVLTPQFIKQELPDIAIIKPQAIELDSKGKGIMFSSNNDSFGGSSYEIWFTDESRLYQITSYGSFASRLQEIIGTWRFN